jgi:hypothetical protein
MVVEYKDLIRPQQQASLLEIMDRYKAAGDHSFDTNSKSASQ